MSRGLLDRFIAEKIATTKHKRQRKAEQKPRLLPKQLAYANSRKCLNNSHVQTVSHVLGELGDALYAQTWLNITDKMNCYPDGL